MAWTRLTAAVLARNAEALTDALMACGALAASIEQDFATTPVEHEIFGEPDQPSPALWPHCLIEALLPLEASAHSIMSAACQLIDLKEAPAYQTDTLADQDWVRLTQSQFEPILAAPGLWITPTWHVPPDPTALNIRLDPGQAFGTGSHPTTQLCLAWLVEHVEPSMSVLDYGCGSGILSIAAKKLGGGRVVGVDLDSTAVVTAQDNARHNEVAADFYLPDAAPSGLYEGVVANILAAPLTLLAPLLLSHLKPGGWIALSGILARQGNSVIEAYKPYCNLSVHAQSGDWVCLAGRKP
jgi:ribosomal protein L11 methyltransferase